MNKKLIVKSIKPNYVTIPDKNKTRIQNPELLNQYFSSCDDDKLVKDMNELILKNPILVEHINPIHLARAYKLASKNPGSYSKLINYIENKYDLSKLKKIVNIIKEEIGYIQELDSSMGYEDKRIKLYYDIISEVLDSNDLESHFYLAKLLKYNGDINEQFIEYLININTPSSLNYAFYYLEISGNYDAALNIAIDINDWSKALKYLDILEDKTNETNKSELNIIRLYILYLMGNRKEFIKYFELLYMQNRIMSSRDRILKVNARELLDLEKIYTELKNEEERRNKSHEHSKGCPVENRSIDDFDLESKPVKAVDGFDIVLIDKIIELIRSGKIRSRKSDGKIRMLEAIRYHLLGYSDEEIAEALDYSIRSVQTYIKRYKLNEFSDKFADYIELIKKNN